MAVGSFFSFETFSLDTMAQKKAPLVLDERCWERARLLSREKSRPKNAAAQRRCFTDIHMVQQRNETESKVKKTSKKKSKHIQQSKKGELVGLRRALCDSRPVIRCRYVGKKSHTQFSNGKKLWSSLVRLIFVDVNTRCECWGRVCLLSLDSRQERCSCSSALLFSQTFTWSNCETKLIWKWKRHSIKN